MRRTAPARFAASQEAHDVGRRTCGREPGPARSQERASRPKSPSQSGIGVCKDVIERFDAFDLNKDGVIDREELGTVLRSLNRSWDSGRLQRLYRVVDLNGDGQIEYAEFAKWAFGVPGVDTKDLRAFREDLSRVNTDPIGRRPKSREPPERSSHVRFRGAWEETRAVPSSSSSSAPSPQASLTSEPREPRRRAAEVQQQTQWSFCSSAGLAQDESMLEHLVAGVAPGREASNRLLSATNDFVDAVLCELDASSRNGNAEECLNALLGPVLHTALQERRRAGGAQRDRRRRDDMATLLTCDKELNQGQPLEGNQIVQLRRITAPGEQVEPPLGLYLLAAGSALAPSGEVRVTLDEELQIPKCPFRLIFENEESTLASTLQRKTLCEKLQTLRQGDKIDFFELEREKTHVLEKPTYVVLLLDQGRVAEMKVLMGSATAAEVENFTQLLGHLDHDDKAEVKRMLEEQNVNLANLDNEGRNALHHARSAACAKIVLEAGPSDMASHRDSTGHTAAEYVLERGVTCVAPVFLNVNPGSLLSIGPDGISAAMRLKKNLRISFEEKLPPWEEEWLPLFHGTPSEISDALEAMDKNLVDRGLDVGDESFCSTVGSVLHFMLYGERQVWQYGRHTQCSEDRLGKVLPAFIILLDNLGKDPDCKAPLKHLFAATRGPRVDTFFDSREPILIDLDKAVSEFEQRTKQTLTCAFNALRDDARSKWLLDLDDALLVPGPRLRQDSQFPGCPNFEHPPWVGLCDFNGALADLSRFGFFANGSQDAHTLTELASAHKVTISALKGEERIFMVLDAMMRREVCQANVLKVKDFFKTLSTIFRCELHARDTAKMLQRILVKAQEAVNEITVQGVEKLEHRYLQTAGDFVVDVNGVEFVAPDITELERIYSWFKDATWAKDGLQLLRIKNGFNDSLTPQDSGYRDLKVWVLVCIEDLPLTVEVQLHLEAFYSRKGDMHVVYKYRRGDFNHAFEDEEDSCSDEEEGSLDEDENGLGISKGSQQEFREDVTRMLKKGTHPDGTTNENGEGLLNLAVNRNDPYVVSMLLENRANPNIVTKQGDTPLHRLSKKGYWDTTTRETLDLLIEARADINQQNNEGLCPLHTAAHSANNNEEGGGTSELINALLAARADVNALSSFDEEEGDGEEGDGEDGRNNEATTALHLAVSRVNLDAIRTLLDGKAQFEMQNGQGLTPLHLAAQSLSVEAVKCLINAGAEVDKSNSEGATALHLAAQTSCFEVVQYLVVDANASKYATDRDGQTPFDYVQEDEEGNLPEAIGELLDVS